MRQLTPFVFGLTLLAMYLFVKLTTTEAILYVGGLYFLEKFINPSNKN